MDCKFCGVENPEDAIFCKSCGKRVDGTVTCPECGKTCAGDAAFCIYCGARLAKAKNAEDKKEVYVKAEKADKSVIVQGESACDRKERSAARWTTAQKILRIISLSSAIAVAGFALIFVFLLGTGVKAALGGESVFTGGTNIYYYFGKGYENFNKLLDNLETYSEVFFVSRMFPLFFGTIISAGALVSVCTLSIMAIVYCSLSLAGKGKKSGEKYAIAAFAVLLAAAVSLVSLENYSTSESLLKISKQLNQASMAGLSLCGVFTFIYLGCAVAPRAKEFLCKNFAVKSALSLSFIVLLFIIVGISSVTVFTVSQRGDGDWTGIKVNMGLLGVYATTAGSYESSGIGLLYNLGTITQNVWDTSDYNTVVALAIVAYSLFVIMVFVGAAAIVKHFTQVSQKDVKGKLTYGIVFAVLSLAFLVFTAVTASEFLNLEKLVDGESSMKVKYPMPIAVFVLSVALLAVSIVQICFEKKFAKPAAVPAEEVALEEGCAEAE